MWHNIVRIESLQNNKILKVEESQVKEFYPHPV